MRNSSFRWNIKSISSGRICDPEWADINSYLIQLNCEDGFAELSINDAPDVGPQNLQIWSEGFNYLGLLGELTDDDYEVRTFTRHEADSKHMVEIAGYLWDSRTVVRDFGLVERAFREFFETDDVSRNLMN
jgi:hypothetical protein